MKYALVVLVAVSLAGCGRLDRWWAGTPGAPSETCVDGVAYLQFTSGATVKYLQNGAIAPCEK